MSALAASTASGAAAAARHSSNPFNTLPDEILVAILKQVPWLKTRFRSAALVCKRFNRLLLSPPLLRNLHFELPGDGADMQRHASMLAAWLQQHATGIVTSLRLASDFPLNPGAAEDGDEASDALESLLEVLPALNSNGQLVEFAVTFCSPVAGSAPISDTWTSAMRSLEKLELDYAEWGGCLWVQPELALLSALHTLTLKGSLVEFPASDLPCFPPSLTRLVLQGYTGIKLPPQMAALPHLRSLRLESILLGPLSYTPLLALSALTHLDLVSVAVPSCLSALTGLQSLRLDTCTGRSQDVQATTEAALPHLTALTQLVLGAAPAVPAALASLTRLARFAWTSGSGRGSEKLPKPDSLRLPGGAWMASMQALNAPGAMVDGSLAELAPNATPNLRFVSIPSFAEQLLPVQARILDWASSHPALRRLEINWVRSEGSLRALVAAMDRKPALAIGFDSGTAGYTSHLWPEPETP